MAHYTTAEAIMHACLAHAAPEVDVLDGIIASSSSPALPRELLFIIRTYLVPAIASDLVDASRNARCLPPVCCAFGEASPHKLPPSTLRRRS